jgi:hypothetical protein
MRSFPGLGASNAALIACYFAPAWGIEAARALTAPFSAFEDRAHATAAIYIRQLFDFGLDGLMRTSGVLAGVKLVIAAGFLAYLIEFARAIAVRREPNRETLDLVLLMAVGAIAVWAMAALALDDAGPIRLHVTELLLVTGAATVITVERRFDRQAEADAETSSAMLSPRREAREPWLPGLVTRARTRRPPRPDLIAPRDRRRPILSLRLASSRE